MEVKPLSSIEEIEKFAKDKYGSTENAWAHRYEGASAETAKPIQKRASDIAYDRISKIAKSQNITIEKLLETEPKLYDAFLEVSNDVVVGPKVF